MSTKKTLEKLKKEAVPIFKKYNVQFVYFFGSRASGKGVAPESDCDVAVFFGQGTSYSRFEKRLRLAYELQEILAPITTQVVALDDIRSVSVLYDVVTKGVLLFERDQGQRIDFELKVDHEYEDFSPFLNAYNKAYLGAV